MTDNLLLSHKESPGSNDRYLFFQNKLVDIPLRPSRTNLPYVLSPFPMGSPYYYGYYIRMLAGLRVLRKLSHEHYMDDFILTNIENLTLDEVFRKAFAKDVTNSPINLIKHCRLYNTHLNL